MPSKNNQSSVGLFKNMGEGETNRPKERGQLCLLFILGFFQYLLGQGDGINLNLSGGPRKKSGKRFCFIIQEGEGNPIDLKQQQKKKKGGGGKNRRELKSAGEKKREGCCQENKQT